MTSRGQLEHLIRQGQILAFEPDFIVPVELILRYFSGYPVKGRLCLFSFVQGDFQSFLYAWDRGFLTPAIVEAGEVAQ